MTLASSAISPQITQFWTTQAPMLQLKNLFQVFEEISIMTLSFTLQRIYQKLHRQINFVGKLIVTIQSHKYHGVQSCSFSGDLKNAHHRGVKPLYQ